MRKYWKMTAAALLAGVCISIAAAAESTASLEGSISSMITLAEMDSEANQAAILALLQGVAAQLEPGSEAAATAASILTLVESGGAQKEAVLVLLDKLMGEIGGMSAAQADASAGAGAETENDAAAAQTEITPAAEVPADEKVAFSLARADTSLPEYPSDQFWWKLLSQDASLQVPDLWYSNDSGSSLVNYSDVSESGHISPAGGTLTTNYYPAEAPVPEQALSDYSGNMAKMKMVSDFQEEDITALGLPGKHLVYRMEAGANDFLCETVCIDYEGTIYSVQMTQGAKSSYNYFPVFDNAVESFTVGEEAVRLVEEQPDHTQTEAQETEIQPQTDTVRDTEIQPQTDTVHETEIQPQTDTVHDTEIQPQTDTVHDTEIQPQTDAAPDTDIQPGTEGSQGIGNAPSGDLASFTYSIGDGIYEFPTDMNGFAPASAWVDPDQKLEYKLTPDYDLGGLWTEISNTEYVFLQDALYQEMIGITNMSGTDVTMRDGVVTQLVDTQGNRLTLTLPGGVRVGAQESAVSAAYPAFDELAWDGYAGIVGNFDMIYGKNVRDDGCNGYVLVKNDPPYYSSLSIICDGGIIREICFECLGSKKAGPVFPQ